MTDAIDHVIVNRHHWDGLARSYVAAGEASWELATPVWGEWSIPDAELALLPEDMSGMRAIELGCGTAYVSAWMARRGASVTGVDNSEAQLRTAARLAEHHGVEIDLIFGNAESVPRPDGSYDFAISEYGAAIWADPFLWIPEAHRLLAPGGELVFLGNHVLATLCSPVDGSLPATERLERPYFGLHRIDWRDAIDEPGGVEFNLPTGEWIRLFLETGFEIAGYVEIRAPATGRSSLVTAEWARRFPAEHVWRLKKR
jgi:SAM-dependent methyltransferase